MKKNININAIKTKKIRDDTILNNAINPLLYLTSDRIDEFKFNVDVIYIIYLGGLYRIISARYKRYFEINYDEWLDSPLGVSYTGKPNYYMLSDKMLEQIIFITLNFKLAAPRLNIVLHKLSKQLFVNQVITITFFLLCFIIPIGIAIYFGWSGELNEIKK